MIAEHPKWITRRLYSHAHEQVATLLAGVLFVGYGLLLGGCHKVFPYPAAPADSGMDMAVSDSIQDRTQDRIIADAPWDAPKLDQLHHVDVFLLNDQKPCEGGGVLGAWQTITHGTFTMGSPEGESCRSTNEESHEVTLTHPFEIQTTEVTQKQFSIVMGYNPSANSMGNHDDYPVEKVSWHEAAAYCNELSKRTCRSTCYSCPIGTGSSVECEDAQLYSGAAIYTCPGYRLPTEAEWEFAYRAGTQTPFYINVSGDISCAGFNAELDTIAWYDSNSGLWSNQVGTKQSNNWGLFDMAGNVYEWCHDWYQYNLGSVPVTDPIGKNGTARAQRGGASSAAAGKMRAATRYPNLPYLRSQYFGFRCVRAFQ